MFFGTGWSSVASFALRAPATAPRLHSLHDGRQECLPHRGVPRLSRRRQVAQTHDVSGGAATGRRVQPHKPDRSTEYVAIACCHTWRQAEPALRPYEASPRPAIAGPTDLAEASATIWSFLRVSYENRRRPGGQRFRGLHGCHCWLCPAVRTSFDVHACLKGQACRMATPLRFSSSGATHRHDNSVVPIDTAHRTQPVGVRGHSST
ncbi:hypothetical protein Mal4_08860 [Maioricimonas rarisocia]|uniref:Uncharacterized protein n=1 Tax=Maioricimonas rarisocia TaxID=2528026 RepID=A0A517Z2B9_9PLAN|nr:hypothetical protein Mal4_08860 [Maioricimonas rarisocia]